MAVDSVLCSVTTSAGGVTRFDVDVMLAGTVRPDPQLDEGGSSAVLVDVTALLLPFTCRRGLIARHFLLLSWLLTV